MQKIILLISICFSPSVSLACENLSGRYEIISDIYSLKIEVEQKNCDEAVFRFHDQKSVHKYLTDGNFYEPTYDSNQNSVSATPIKTSSNSFVKAFINGTRITVQEFDGKFETCNGKYSFSDFNCEMREFSIGFNTVLNSLTWRHIGMWRSQDGRYEDSEFKLRKI